MTIEIIIKDIESKTKKVGSEFVCDWFGKEFAGNTVEEVKTKIIDKFNLGTMPKIVSSGSWLKPRRNTWRNR